MRILNTNRREEITPKGQQPLGVVKEFKKRLDELMEEYAVFTYELKSDLCDVQMKGSDAHAPVKLDLFNLPGSYKKIKMLVENFYRRVWLGERK